MKANPWHNNTFKIFPGSQSKGDITVTCDVVIIGTGSGGGTAAKILAEKGYEVALIEEGPLKHSDDFKMRESEAYPQLYQECASRTTKDKAINILQGRSVGGGTTVNWTTSFRTPETTLSYWNNELGLKEITSENLRPWFEKIEREHGIHQWEVPPNENNDTLARGLGKMKIPYDVIKRNVKECHNLGFCGTGCPVNAKQSTLITSIPQAMENKASLFPETKAIRFEFQNKKISELITVTLQDNGNTVRHTRRFKAKHFICSAGAIGTPALLMRSHCPDPHKILGKRTFLHPVTISAALMKEKVEAFYGAPQVIYSDHFLEVRKHSDKAGYKLETPPIHPILLATTIREHGEVHRTLMEKFPWIQATIALQRDGFHPESPGGNVELIGEHAATLDYPITEYMREGFRDSLLTMAELQFAAGAKHVVPLHSNAKLFSSWNECRQAIKDFSMHPHYVKLVCAHVMGGAPMGRDEKSGVVDQKGRHFHVKNLSVMDGSLFPTSIAANPMESILGLTAKLASEFSLN